MAKKQEQKTPKCPISRDEFLKDAKPFMVTIGGRDYLFEPKVFSTGSFGWGMSDKIVLKVGETPCKTQASLNLTIVGSKDA